MVGDGINGAKRILIYGVTGAGKSTFATRLGQATGLPVHLVDDLAWLPGWQQTTDEFQADAIGKICETESWILDTAYGKWIDIPLAKVELILALDYPRWFSLARLLKRTISRCVDKKPICNGNHESLRTVFSHDSIILWHFKSFRRKRHRIHAWQLQENGPRVVAFRTAREAESWLKGL